MRATLTTLVLLGLSLTVMRSALGVSVRCSSLYDEGFRRYVTECADGSRAITRYDADFKRWRTDITKDRKAKKPYDWAQPLATPR